MNVVKSYVTTSGGQIHLARVAGDGPPVVFVHKTVSTYRMWLGVMAALPAGREMIALETPGFGESFDPPAQVPITAYADWLCEALDGLGVTRCHLVGHHTGAVIALDMASRRPDLVASLTLIGPLPLSAQERREHAERFNRPFPPTASGGYLLDTWDYVRWAGAGADVALMNREMSAMLRSWQTRAWTYAAVWEHDFEAQYRSVAAPLMIMCAPDDVLYDYFARSQSLRPDATAVLLSGGANYETDLVPVEVANPLADHMRSVDRTDLKT